MNNILVTGAAGYIGSKVAYDLIDKSFKVVAIDDLSNGYKKFLDDFKNCIIQKILLKIVIFKSLSIKREKYLEQLLLYISFAK